MTMRFATIVVAFAVAGGGSVRVGRAAPPGLADPLPLTAPSGFPFALASADMLKLRDITVRDRAKAKEESGKLVRAIQLSCELTDAALIGRGKGNADGKIIDVNAYEVACSNHAGYILVSQGSEKPLAMCEPTNMRVIGRESVDKRYVVEVKCQEQTNGLVAFIPVGGNTNKFEAIDCAAAVERQIRCELGAK
jgi:hypothetical protein